MKRFILCLSIITTFLFFNFGSLYSVPIVLNSYVMEPFGWTVTHYSLTITNPLTGLSRTHFRTVITDPNGGEVWSGDSNSGKKALFENEDNICTYEIYPNPTSDFVFLTPPSGSENKTLITLYDMNLKQIKQLHNEKIGSEGIVLSLSNLPSGNYFLTIKNENKISIKHLSIIK